MCRDQAAYRVEQYVHAHPIFRIGFSGRRKTLWNVMVSSMVGAEWQGWSSAICTSEMACAADSHTGDLQYQ